MKRQTKKSIIFLILIFLALFALNCKKTKTIRTDTSLMKDPGAKKKSWITRVKRGEYVEFLKEKSFGKSKYLLVKIDGSETQGWIRENHVLDGELEVLTVTSESILYQRPSKNAPKKGKVKVGQKVFLLDKKGDFSHIEFPPNLIGYILTSNLSDKPVKSSHKVHIKGIGEAGVSSSSHLVPSVGKELKYHPKNLFDGDLKTAWCEGKVSDPGIGETVFIKFSERITLEGIEVVNGWAKSEELYNKNNRAAKITLGADSESFDLQDGNLDFQKINLTDSLSYSGHEDIKIKMTDIYKGTSTDNDTCISEIRLIPREPKVKDDGDEEEDSENTEPAHGDYGDDAENY